MPVTAAPNTITWNIVNKNLTPGDAVREKLRRKIARLTKHLVHFPPDTLHLQVVLQKLAKKETHAVRLTLRLPFNILHAEKSDEDLLDAVDAATSALEREVDSLKGGKRGDYRWKRSARRAALRALTFSDPMEDGAGPQSDTEVVAELLAAHVSHLLAHARRAIRMAELTGELPAGAVDPRDVVDEAVRICLEHPGRMGGKLTFEQRFYQLIRAELDRQVRCFSEEQTFRTEAEMMPPFAEEELEESIIRKLEPDERLFEEKFADQSAAPADQMISGRELVDLLQQEVKNWPPNERDIFELHYMAGFDAIEIAMIRHWKTDEVEELLSKIQQRFRDFLREAAR